MPSWAHQFVGEVLAEGDLAVDLTAGRGKDTLFLSRCVGPSGQVLAFDIQRQALQTSQQALLEAGITAPVLEAGAVLPVSQPGVCLIHDSHAHVGRYLAQFSRPPRAFMANLGYLPGGDAAVTTQGDSTLAAVEAALAALAVGGRLALVLYIGHPEGRKEATLLSQRFSQLSARQWYVLKVETSNRQEAPFLLVAEKRR
ncbi:MAG: class I SAM-dependent methyltransferase [Desulfuromonadales bacterium]|nr:class I SAM-dependent methyltransferase [Desulfuromonadales bacterium]